MKKKEYIDWLNEEIDQKDMEYRYFKDFNDTTQMTRLAIQLTELKKMFKSYKG
jgi:hypothetical protein